MNNKRKKNVPYSQSDDTILGNWRKIHNDLHLKLRK